jgi:hypothetical protein
MSERKPQLIAVDSFPLENVVIRLESRIAVPRLFHVNNSDPAQAELVVKSKILPACVHRPNVGLRYPSR